MNRTFLTIVILGLAWPSLQAETSSESVVSIVTDGLLTSETLSVGDLPTESSVVSSRAADGSTSSVDMTLAVESVEGDSSSSIVETELPFAEAETAGEAGVAEPAVSSGHRMWLVSTRSLPSDACIAPLESPQFRVWRLDRCGNTTCSSLAELLESRSANNPMFIQVHGNRIEADETIPRGLFVYHKTIPHTTVSSLDYVLFSWPADKEGLLINDGRVKAEKTDAEGLYLAWLIREFTQRGSPICIVGYSFGGRIATGAMHALAGGSLSGRSLPGEHVQGANVRVCLIAPALEDNWLRSGKYHGMASLNMERMTILYNQRDAVLKRYWLLDQVRGRMALGYTGPKGVAPRVDGTPMPIHSCDCSPSMGVFHDEKMYYNESCQAGRQVASLINSLQ